MEFHFDMSATFCIFLQHQLWNLSFFSKDIEPADGTEQHSYLFQHNNIFFAFVLELENFGRRNHSGKIYDILESVDNLFYTVCDTHYLFSAAQKLLFVGCL